MSSTRNIHDRRLADAWATLKAHADTGQALEPDANRLAFADPAAFAGQCFLRAERQTFFPVTGVPRQVVFTIRVMIEPLAQAVRLREDAQRLHDALASMSDAVLAYKNLAPARDRLLAWLAARSA